MGILDLALGNSNPFSSWADQNRNWLRGVGAGVASGPNFGQGLSNAAQNGYAGAQLDDQIKKQQEADAKRQGDINMTAAWLRKNFPQYGDLPTDQAFQLAMQDMQAQGKGADPFTLSPGETRFGADGQAIANVPADTKGGADPSDVATYKFYANQELSAGRPPKSFDDWFRGSKQAAKAGLGQPIYGKNRKTGEYMPFEPMSDGSVISLTDKNANPADFIFDPGTVASDKAAGGAFGALQGGQQYNQPKAAQDIETELGNIDALVANSAGMDQTFGNLGGFNIGGVGYPNQWTPTLPNTPKAGFEAQMKQVAGENFLSAYATLRGSGAITEVEGQQAKEAMARLSTAQSKDDFLKAVADLKGILVKGYQTMSQQTAGGPYQSTGYTPPPLAGKNYVYNPATGELE